ncbi:ABA4-like family protein [Truepera radiovictrix]|uniref:DUF4281 domain-containing protein n=1 Tax=Truepera radiovictrix (strain DSM 17093 / CIP 108686 / LMG 22925 / RQ-24) TaxID=649638 RepID=D7CWJ5_TRURR|nr:ABA4-like family protein [Truepera radiovictrix]ADI14394.1 conserved hypothetical protein [Truepera radiovictrix DSM 17093]WMT57049.1 ABA4-like family protein [Truepera radiovictrix]
MAEFLFNLTTLLPLPVWLGMLLFPRSRFTERLVRAAWPFIALAALYTLLLLAALLGGASLDLSFGGLRTTFTLPWPFLAVWAHLVTLDLFAGVWIFRDAKYWGLNPRAFLFVTLFFGPLGLGAYLVAREHRARHDPLRVN